MGSRAKLADVPKLHELIQHQIHKILVAKGTWKVVLPGLGSVAEAKGEVLKEELTGSMEASNDFAAPQRIFT